MLFDARSDQIRSKTEGIRFFSEPERLFPEDLIFPEIK